MEVLRKQSAPSYADVMDRARALVPKLRARSAEINKARHVPADVIAMIDDAGLMQLARPACYGGPELGMDLLFNVARTLAEGDGSTAWVYAVGNSHDHLVGLYPKEIQDEYWQSAQPLCASSYQPQGKATKVDGGYRLTGRWSFCSGIDHCGWIVVGTLLFQEAGPPRLLLMLLRKADLEVVDDWYMMGLSGTGSKTVVVDDLFVPDTQILDNADVMLGNTPGAAIHGNPLYHASIWLLFGFSILAPTTGIVRGAYEAMIADSRAKAASGDPMFASRKTQVQSRLADAGVLLESCELLFESSLEETAAAVMSGGPISDALRTRNRRNQAYIARTCRQAMDLLMQLAGGRGLKDDAPVQRATRDVFAISAHPGGNWDAASASFGSVLLGGPPTEMFC